jgi:anhydro-N-acetylmuramic acid kinase
MKVLRAIGLMSGTSMDGIDVALIETNGTDITASGATFYRPYSADERALLSEALKEGARLQHRDERSSGLLRAEDLVTRCHALAVERFLEQHNIDPQSIDVIGFHGQTVLHKPEQKLTVQLGDGQALAQRLNIKVVHDFRAADVAAGGQGAPLVPIFHAAMIEKSQLNKPVAVVNIGGVANVTFIDRDGALLAFDTGPGNALINDHVQDKSGLPFDDQGAIAARGRADESLLAWLMVHPFFAQKPPKSLDRNMFSADFVRPLNVEDAAATLTAFTVRALIRATDFMSEPPKTWIIAGGGAHNVEMMRLLKRGVEGEVITADALGWPVDFLEAQAFAYLAVRSLYDLPMSFPSTTGVPQALCGGLHSL